MIKLYGKLFFLLVGALAVFVLWQRTQLAALALTRTDPLPKTYELMAEGHFAEAGNYLEFFMGFEYVNQNPKAQELNKEINDIRSKWTYQGGKVLEGVLYGNSDELIGQSAGVVSDFFIIGDLRDVTAQGINLARGEKVDKVLLALAGLGIAASAAQAASVAGTFATAGAATPALMAASEVKSGLIALKLARKLGRIPPWVVKYITKTFTAYKTSGKLNIRSLKEIASNAKLITSTPGGLRMIGETRNASELNQMAVFVSKLKEHSLSVYRIGGMTAVKLADQVSSKTLALAATFGRNGIRILSYIGPEKFEKAVSKTRKLKALYKGEIFPLIAMLLSLLPTWALALCVTISTLICAPKKILLRITQKLFRGSVKTKMLAHERRNE